MFRELIDKPIDPIPSGYTNSLERLACEPDYSLTCLGVALLKPRIEEYKGITGKYIAFTREETAVTDFIDIASKEHSYPVFCYYIYDHPSENVQKMIEENGLEIKASIGALLKEKADVKCIAVYHKTKNCAAVFINSKDTRLYHILISFISLLFPALFKNNPLKSPEDYNLIRALSKTDKDAFIQRIQESVTPYIADFRRMVLGNMIMAMHEKKVTEASANVYAQRMHIENLEKEFSEQYKLLRRLIAEYEGLKTTETYDKPEEELVEYLSTNKAIHNLNVNNNKMSFTVATLLNNYNADAWETFSTRGYIYDGKYATGGRQIELLNAFSERHARKTLLDSIFCETPEFVVKIAGNYTLDLDNYRITTSRNYNYVDADPIFKSYLPNPHLKLFACLGGYEHRINMAIRKKNYIGALEMCCASAGSVDLDETEQTFRPFIGWIMSSREKILRRKDGVDMTPEEALLYLIDKEKENETNSNE